ncbi:MAG: deoxynucleoside kinase [Candidatus Neomarinimicrobiota bacterium]
MVDKQKTLNPLIGLAGNIGVGKTTFTKLMSECCGWIPFYEVVSDNPYLSDFYDDMKRWSFNLQIYFLHKRFVMHQEMSKSSIGVIQDRTIYEDKEIFAKNLHKIGKMSDRDWVNYQGLFKVMAPYLKKPNLIIYLKASTDTLLNRIKNRGRIYENSISPEYIHNLNISYDRWIESVNEYPVMTILTDDFNIFEDSNKFDEIKHDIIKRI